MIRQFQLQDALPCSTLILSCLRKDPSYAPALLQKILRTETPQAMKERAKSFYIGVYTADDQILGLAGLDLNEIRLLYVSPEHQRRGIGRTLLAHLKAMVPHALFADVFVYSTKQAVAFYRACGFVELGPFNFDLDGETLPTVFLTSPLRQNPPFVTPITK